jgi:hypothetical protein
MRPLSYRQLFVALQELTEEQLDMSVSVLLDDEILSIYDTIVASELPDGEELYDVVEENQPLLTLVDY